ncbi:MULTISPECIES: hypothetical protein [Bradyrhizobium]|uniref:hypothetical protein n=1 Tax=Bradyrhizobium elkanii TaxID=29448 RepID=UPI0004083F1C|nr:hypothetical protein [Bradyrhizobium elkanii]
MSAKMAIAALLAVLATAASAQQRAFYDSSGKVVGRSTTDSQGTTTFYDGRGRVTATEFKSGTLYDERGRVLGRRQ